MSHKIIQFISQFTLALRRLPLWRRNPGVNRTSGLGHYITYLRNWRKAAYTSTVLLTLTIMAILFPISFRSATPVEAVSGTPKQSTLTFAYVDNKSTASVSLNISDPSGTFATSNDNEKAVFTLSTDNYTGYTLRLKTTGATTLTDGTNTIESIPTDGITSSSTAWDTNRWGLLPSYYNSSSNTANYYRATTDGFLMDQTSSANSTPKQYTVGMGLKADYNTPAGTYTSSAIVAEYVARPISYSISYNKGGISGTPTSGTIPATQSDVVSGTSVTLSSTTPSGIAGYTFVGWCNTNTTSNGTLCNGTTTPTFTAGGNYGIDQTTSNTVTLYALWSAIDYTITINAGAGVSTLTASGWTGTGTATLTKTYHIDDTIDLTTITPTRKTGYTGTAYIITSGSGSISSSTYTVGAGNGTITIKATGLNTPTCTIQGGATKVYNRSATTLTATDNSENYDTSSVDITYSFGYASNGTNDLASFSTAQTGTTLSISANAFRGARYYGVKVVVTDKTDSSITSTCTSGTVDAAVTGTNVDNRTTMTLVNSRINFNATTNGGTLSGTSPVYVYYNGTATYSSRTGSTARAIPTATKSGYNFTGWWTAASGGSKVINADGTLTGVAVSGWTSAGKKWVKTGTSDSSTATANQLYAQYEVACTHTTFSGNMQSLAASTVTNACVGDTGTLTDTRDSKTYSVAKLADNKLWMTENLALDLVASKNNITSANTNATDQALGYLKGTTTGTSSNQWATAAVTKTGWTSSSQNQYSIPRIVLSGTCRNAYCVDSPSSGNWSYDAVTSATINGTASIAQGKIGVYYNYCAASAGSYCWGNGTSDTGSPSSDPNTSSLRDITSDICPKGWRLPTGGGSGEFKALYTAYSSNYTNFQTALSTPLSGFCLNGEGRSQGNTGRFWSSTWGSSMSMYSLNVDSTSVNLNNLDSRYYGNSVRCVFGS